MQQTYLCGWVGGKKERNDGMMLLVSDQIRVLVFLYLNCIALHWKIQRISCNMEYIFNQRYYYYCCCCCWYSNTPLFKCKKVSASPPPTLNQIQLKHQKHHRILENTNFQNFCFYLKMNRVTLSNVFFIYISSKYLMIN